MKELRERYAELTGKYGLPEFRELDEGFEISKIEREDETLMRAVRKTMMEKIVSSLNFLEMLFNPMNAPRMYMNYIKNMSVEDKEAIDKIYAAFSELSLLSLAREVDYDEAAEAELVKTILEKWNSFKPDFRRIFNNIKKPVSAALKKERSYFG